MQSKNWGRKIDDGFANDKPLVDVMEDVYQDGIKTGEQRVIKVIKGLDRQMAALVESVITSKR